MFVHSMEEVKCCFRVSRKVFSTFEIMLKGPGIDYFSDGYMIFGPKHEISKWNYLKWLKNGEVDIFR